MKMSFGGGGAGTRASTQAGMRTSTHAGMRTSQAGMRTSAQAGMRASTREGTRECPPRQACKGSQRPACKGSARQACECPPKIETLIGKQCQNVRLPKRNPLAEILPSVCLFVCLLALSLDVLVCQSMHTCVHPSSMRSTC